MTHPLVEMWRKDPHTRAFHHYADALESLLTTVYTDPPSIEAFRAHTTAHGFDKYDQRYGWLRVKCYSGWVQASCRVVDPSTWEGWRGDKAPYVLCELFQGSKGSPSIACHSTMA